VIDSRVCKLDEEFLSNAKAEGKDSESDDRTIADRLEGGRSMGHPEPTTKPIQYGWVR